MLSWNEGLNGWGGRQVKAGKENVVRRETKKKEAKWSQTACAVHVNLLTEKVLKEELEWKGKPPSSIPSTLWGSFKSRRKKTLPTLALSPQEEG